MNIHGEDDITVLSPEDKDDHYNVHENFLENDFPLFLGSHKPDSNTHQSLHVLQRAYNDLKRRYNDTTQKCDIMSRALKDIETQRIHQVKQHSLYNGLGAANGPGTEASGSSGASDNSADAQLRAQMGYAESLQRQIMRMNEREKEMERKYYDLYTKYKRLEDDNTALQEKNRKLMAESQTAQAELVKEISSKDLVIKQKDNEIEQLKNLNKSIMDRCNILEQRLVKAPGLDSYASPLTMKQERHIIDMIDGQNEFLKELKQRMQQQDEVIKKQNGLIKALTSKSNLVVGNLPKGADDPRSTITGAVGRSQRDRYPGTSERVLQQCSEESTQPQDNSILSRNTIMAPSDDYLPGLTLPPSFQTTSTMRQGGAIPKFPMSQRVGIEGDAFDAIEIHGPRHPRPMIQLESRRSRSESSQLNVQNTSKDTTHGPGTKPTSPYNMQPIYLPPSSPRLQQADTFVDPQQMRHQNSKQTNSDRAYHENDIPTVGARPLLKEGPAGRTQLNEMSSKPPLIFDNRRVPQQNVDCDNRVNIPVHVESDYVNTPDIKHDVSSNSMPQHDVSSNNMQQVCPVCKKSYRNMPLEEFQMHILDCVDENDSDAEYTFVQPDQSKATGNKECPMCGAAFPMELPQEEFERHVQEHFREEAIEILNP